MSLNETPSRRAVAVISFLGAIAVTVLCACAEPTGTDSHPKLAEVQLLNAAASQATPRIEQGNFSDLYGRILPSFADRLLAGELAAQLANLDAASQADNRPAAEAAVKNVRKLLDRSDAHLANIGAIRMALHHFEELFGLPEAGESEAVAENSKDAP